MLSGNDVFVRGIRRGVELGEYVYQRGELLFGPGDPAPTIEIDEQSMIFTMAYARNESIWPRPTKKDEESKTSSEIRERPSDDTTSPTSPPAIPRKAEFAAEGPFREALTKLWEQARDRNVEALDTLAIEMFEPRDAFPMVNAVNAVAGAAKTVRLTGGYETRDGGHFLLEEFSGPPSDAQPVREFLEPQFRGAATSNIQATFTLDFTDGLPMKGDAPEALAGQLTRFANGAAHVSASAVARPEASPPTNSAPPTPEKQP